MEDKETEAAAYVQGFITRFKFRFGVVPIVSYDLKIPTTVPLEVIKDAANAVLDAVAGQHYSEGISSVYTDNDVLLCRWVYYKLAVDNKHSPMRAARFIKQNAANSLYGRGKINKLILEGNERATTIYNKTRAHIDKQLFGDMSSV